MELKITKDKVLAAAGKCPDAKRTLEVLFPEAFKVDPQIDLRKSSTDLRLHGMADGVWICIEPRDEGPYEGIGFYLTGSVLWELVTDPDGVTVLIPRRQR